jgi:hypothetical protein
LLSSNDDSALSTTPSFSVTGTNPAAALFSITDALPGDFVEKDVSVTTSARGSLTLAVTAGSAPGVAAPLGNAPPDDRGLMVRVEQCASSFAPGTCSGVAGLNGGATAGVASGAVISSASSVSFYTARGGGPVILQTDQPAGTFYYKVFLKVPANTTSGGTNSDLTFQNTSAVVTYTWQLTSSPGRLRSTP